MLQARTSGASLQSLFERSPLLARLQDKEFGVEIAERAVVDLAKDP